MKDKLAEANNPVLEEIRELTKALHRANEALAQRCNCRFDSGGFHKATCPYHERIFKRLALAEYEVMELKEKR